MIVCINAPGLRNQAFLCFSAFCSLKKLQTKGSILKYTYYDHNDVSSPFRAWMASFSDVFRDKLFFPRWVAAASRGSKLP